MVIWWLMLEWRNRHERYVFVKGRDATSIYIHTPLLSSTMLLVMI